MKNNIGVGQKVKVRYYENSEPKQHTVVAVEDDGKILKTKEDHAWTIDGRPDRGTAIYKYQFNPRGKTYEFVENEGRYVEKTSKTPWIDA